MGWLKSAASLAYTIRIIWIDVVFMVREWNRKRRVEDGVADLRGYVDGLFDRAKADPASIGDEDGAE